MIKAKVIAEHLNLKDKELRRLGLLTLLKDKKMEILRDRLEILSRYNVFSDKELRKKIYEGEIPEHPAWEDLIVIENLDFTVGNISNDIRKL